MAETDNLKLALPASNEYVDVEVLNENFRKIDTAVLLALAAAAPYNTSQTYALGAYCTRGGKLYRCTTAISAVEAWTDAHWTETTMGAELVSIYMTLASKAESNHTHTPASIGAAASDHTHTPASIGAAASNHTHTPASIGAYSKAETDALLANKRNWNGGIVTGVSILDWAAAQAVPTDCSCDATTSDMPYAGYWMIQLCIYPDAGWKTLKATNILSGDTWSRNYNVSTWDTAWRKHLDSATTTPASIGASGMKLLWVNAAAHTAHFPGQVISLDLSNYDYIAVRAKVKRQENNCITFFLAKDGYPYLINYDWLDTSKNELKRVERTYTCNNSGVIVGDGYIYNTTNDNDFIVPWSVYGINVV